jgi:hypothetical protein
MGFLRRLLGGEREASSPPDESGDDEGSDEPAGPAAVDDEERARDLELARFEQDRTDDLVRRQQRYADRSWTPPAQGGERRSDDGDKASG